MEYQAPYGSTDPDASYVDRNSAAAVKGSAVPAAAIEDPQRELAALIIYGGLTPDEDDLTQVAKAIQSGALNYAIAGGTANALTATLNPVPEALAAGLCFLLKIVSTNTGAVTMNLNGLGVTAVTRADGSPLQKADLPAGSIACFAWDGTSFQVQGLTTAYLPGRNITAYAVAGTYTFTVPDGVYKIYCTCVGGGGGAGGMGVNGSGVAYPAGGGGAGGTSSGWIDVTPGQTITIIVGAAGTGGAASSSSSAGSYGSNGTSGGTSSVGSYMSATGGNYGGATSAGSAGGTGGVGTGGQINQYGGNGTDGSGGAGVQYYGGSGGSSSQGGGGRSATAYSATVQNGQAPGSGGGSVYNIWASTAKGGNGADGFVALQY